MKKVSLCIGAFMVLFLVVGVYTAQAQADLSAFDGLWLQDLSKFRYMVIAGAIGSETLPERGANEAYRNYTCMEVDPANAGTINLYTYYRNGDPAPIYGYLYWQSGTNEDFFGKVEFFDLDGFEYDFAYVTVINGKFKAVPGYGTYSNGTDRFETWDFVWNAKIPRRVPSAVLNVGCGFVTNGT
jgi:hypothetical protein